MEKPAPSDPELLAEWLGQQREPAFHALVARYAGLVHATARRTCGDDSMAAEASQLTFIALARKAKSLTSCASLGGWLHTTAMMQAKNLIRKSQRENRKRQLLQAAMEIEAPHAPNDVWKEMQPILDDALAALSDKDREALLLRFYRSLTIREIAATLGIATDAAQKRINRATERLREKLTRRGCQAGGSLSAALLAGFAADAQAAVPAVSLLASKAIAAGAVGGGVVPLAFISAGTMKTTSLALPLIALLAAGAWFASQRQAIVSFEDRNADLEKRLAMTTKASVRDGSGGSRLTADARGTPNWKAIAEQLIAMQTTDQAGYNKVWRSWQLRLASMEKETLASELDRIVRLELSPEENALLTKMFVEPVIDKDPELALKRFPHDLASPVRSELAGAWREWIRLDRAKALAWFDAEIAAGTFDGKSPTSGKQGTRIQFEAILFDELLGDDPEMAGRRIAALPEGYRHDTVANYLKQLLDEKAQMDFAIIVRTHLPAAEQARAIASGLRCLPSNGGYAGITAYFEAIRATPSEREACANEALSNEIVSIVHNTGKLTREPIDRFREWAKVQAPDAMERLTGHHLATLGTSMPVSEAVALAVGYFAESGSDEVLDMMFQMQRRYMVANAQALAASISDEALRERFLDRVGKPQSPSDARAEKLKESFEKQSR
ncbi:MAG: RNA polymerase sigma factor [Verrucomicrobiota bacterium]